MSKRTRNQPSNVRREIVTPDGLITVPPGSPKILIHTQKGRCVSIYCDQPAKVLVVETQDDPRRAVHPSYHATLSIISPQTIAKAVGGYGTAVDHVLAMAFDDPDMDDDLRRALNAHEVVLDEEWPDVW
jgi:transcriptional regulator of met regulon